MKEKRQFTCDIAEMFKGNIWESYLPDITIFIYLEPVDRKINEGHERSIPGSSRYKKTPQPFPFRPFIPENPNDTVWSVIRKPTTKVGEPVTTRLREIAEYNPALGGIIDRVDFNATTHGIRDIEDDRLSNLIEKVSEKRLGLKDVKPDIIGRSYEYLIRKFAEGGGQSAGEFYTPRQVGLVMAELEVSA